MAHLQMLSWDTWVNSVRSKIAEISYSLGNIIAEKLENQEMLRGNSCKTQCWWRYRVRLGI